MTDTDREFAADSNGAGERHPALGRPNVGEYLLAMSHEIRAPLNAVIGMSGMLLEGDLGEKNRQYAKSVHSAGESLAAILNDLLDLSRVTAGRLMVEPIPFDLKSTIEETASVLTPRAADRGLMLRVDWRPELPRQVVGDPGRTRQVLGNLVGHAVNATSQGEVVIRVMPDGERHGVPAIRFVVEDTGIGIVPERLANIFDEYVPVDASPYRSFGVTGLGLRLSADLVRRMGGEIGAESEAGRGSRFWFVLPMPSAEQAPTPAMTSPPRAGRALVVEADAAARGRYVDQIVEAGWDVEVIDHYGLAIDTLRRAAEAGDPFLACFISDYAVRPLHIELAVKLKSEVELAKTALVMVTAVGSPGEGKKLWHAGFAAYLRKPVPHEEMRDALSALQETGAEGRGPTLITRHSLAEARNAQGFASDDIDEMLATLAPATEELDSLPPAEPVPVLDTPTEDREVESPPSVDLSASGMVEEFLSSPAAVPAEAELPPRITSYLPLFAAAPAPVAPPEPEPIGIAMLEEPAAPIEPTVDFVEMPVSDPDSGIAEGPMIELAAPVEQQPEPNVEPAALELTWDRPEEFDPTEVEIERADGLDTPESLVAKIAGPVEGLEGHEFGQDRLIDDAEIEPIEALPPGAVVDLAPSLLKSAEPEPEDFAPEFVEPTSRDPDADRIELDPAPAEITLETPAEVPVIEVAALESEVAAHVPEPPPTEPAVTAAAETPASRDLPDIGSLDVVASSILDQLTHGGGYFTQYLVSTFAREVPSAIAELATAANRGDGNRIKAAVAALRTAAGHVGAARLAAQADRIEHAVGLDLLDEATAQIGTVEQAFVAARDALDRAAPTGLPADIPAVGGAFLDQLGPDREGPAKALAVRLIDSFNNDATAKIIELREAVARGDADTAQRLAQTVKGMCGLISAEPLAKLCALVEADARLKRIGQAGRYLDHLDRELSRVWQILTAARG